LIKVNICFRLTQRLGRLVGYGLTMYDNSHGSLLLNKLTRYLQINRHIIPGFYRYLQEQDPEKQAEFAGEFKTEIGKLIDAADSMGPFFLGRDISFVDVQIAPWVLRLNRVLKPYRGWPEPEPESRWAKWVEAIQNNEHVKATTSSDDLYLDSYERYAGKCLFTTI
jgi:glutathione S-transferase